MVGSRCSEDIYRGFLHKQSIGEGAFTASLDRIRIVTAKNTCGLKPLAFNHENASDGGVDRNSTKKRKVSRIVGGGLRQFSVIVCKKLESKGSTTYSEVADEIVAEFATTQNGTEASFDEVLSDKLMIRIGKKTAYLKDLEEQIADLQNLMLRNQQLYKGGSGPSGGLTLPFILVQTNSQATVEIEISEDKQLVHCDFNSTPFHLRDDSYILKSIRYYQLAESRHSS